MQTALATFTIAEVIELLKDQGLKPGTAEFQQKLRDDFMPARGFNEKEEPLLVETGV